MPPKASAKGAKKAAKVQKGTRTGDKKRRKTRKESYSVYIYRPDDRRLEDRNDKDRKEERKTEWRKEHKKESYQRGRTASKNPSRDQDDRRRQPPSSGGLRREEEERHRGLVKEERKNLPNVCIWNATGGKLSYVPCKEVKCHFVHSDTKPKDNGIRMAIILRELLPAKEKILDALSTHQWTQVVLLTNKAREKVDQEIRELDLPDVPVNRVHLEDHYQDEIGKVIAHVALKQVRPKEAEKKSHVPPRHRSPRHEGHRSRRDADVNESRKRGRQDETKKEKKRIRERTPSPLSESEEELSRRRSSSSSSGSRDSSRSPEKKQPRVEEEKEQQDVVHYDQDLASPGARQEKDNEFEQPHPDDLTGVIIRQMDEQKRKGGARSGRGGKKNGAGETPKGRKAGKATPTVDNREDKNNDNGQMQSADGVEKRGQDEGAGSDIATPGVSAVI